jgi:hypothetical protein
LAPVGGTKKIRRAWKKQKKQQHLMRRKVRGGGKGIGKNIKCVVGIAASTPVLTQRYILGETFLL